MYKVPIRDLKYKLIHLRQEEIEELNQENQPVRTELLYISFLYEDGNTRPGCPKMKSGHRPLLCPFMSNGHPCGFTGYARNGPVRYHDCLGKPPPKRQTFITDAFPKATVHFNPWGSKTASSNTRETDLQKLLLLLLGQLLAGTTISLRFVCSPFFNYWLGRVIRVGQQNPTTPLSQIIPNLTQRKLSDSLLEQGDTSLSMLLDNLRNKFVSIMFDGTKVNHKKYVAVTVCTHEQYAKPVFLTIVHAPQKKEDFSKFVIEIIRWLILVPCEVTSICTDGQRAQTSGIKMAINELKQNTAITYIPFYVPCMNHLTNLITVHMFDYQADIQKTRETICEFADEASSLQRQSKLKKRCPMFIKTRWLSLSQVCAYIRLKRGIITTERYLSLGSIISSLGLEAILTPLSELHIFLETDSTKLHQVFPALIRSLLQYKLLLTHPQMRTLEWASVIADILTLFYTIIFDTDIGQLVALAFAATPVGHYLLTKERFASGYTINLSLEECTEKLYALFVIRSILVFCSQECIKESHRNSNSYH